MLVFLWRFEHKRRRINSNYRMGQNNHKYDGRKQRRFSSVDALVNLAEPMHKEYSTIFVWGHLFSTYVSYDRC